LVFAILLLFESGIYTQGTWEKLDVPTQYFLRSVYFVDSLYGWATGDSGTILHTSDGGNNWLLQNSQTENEIYEVFFLNRDTGWASSFHFSSLPYGTLLLKTTNGGEEWIGEPYPEENIFITCILFTDFQNGWMGGRPHALVNTTDGGITWEQAAIDTTPLAFFPVLNIQFYDDKFGYACGGILDIAGVIWYTWNGGEKWYPVDASFTPADEVHQVHLYDSINVLAAGGDPDFGYGVSMLRTGNGGLSWDYEEIGIPGNAFDVDFRSAYEAWCPLGPQQKLIYSLDSGTTWTDIATPESTAIFDMIFPDSTHGFAVGENGAVIKYTPPLTVSDKPIPFNQFNIMLEQNFPNPFTTTTHINFSIPASGSSNNSIHNPKGALVGLKVFNAYGEVITSLVDAWLLPGEYQMDFNGTTLPAGIYLYKLEVQSKGSGEVFSASKRMLLVH